MTYGGGGGHISKEDMPYRNICLSGGNITSKGMSYWKKIFDLKVCLKWKCVIQENLFYRRTCLKGRHVVK